MRVLLTGATGFVGQALGRELVRAGHEVVALVRKKTSLAFPAELRLWSDTAALRNIEAVIHLAGESVAGGRWTEARRAELVRSRVESTALLREKVRASGSRPKAWLNASAVGYYGDRGEEELTEVSAPGNDFLAGLCQAWEAEASKAEELGSRVVCFRIGLVLDKGGGALERMLPPFRLGLGGALGDGKQWLSWIHRQDLARLFVFALENPSLRGPVNAVTPAPVTNRDFSAALAHSLGKKLFLPVPAWTLRLALGEMSQLLLSSQKSTGVAALHAGFRFRYPAITEALAEICGSP